MEVCWRSRKISVPIRSSFSFASFYSSCGGCVFETEKIPLLYRVKQKYEEVLKKHTIYRDMEFIVIILPYLQPCLLICFLLCCSFLEYKILHHRSRTAVEAISLSKEEQ